MLFSSIKLRYLTLILTISISVFFNSATAQELAILKYKGGGDWYANPTALPNLIAFCNTHINTKITPKPQTIEAGSSNIFQFPLLHMTGHGNVFFNETEVDNLQQYLLSGGFLHIDDNYGMKPYVIEALKSIFPEKKLIELTANHPIFNWIYKFPNGLPKIHEHDGKRPQAFGIFNKNRLIVLFTYESDLGDGWESPEVHNDSQDVREKALKMGANIIKYVFEN